MEKIDRHRAAIALKGAMVMRGMKQDEVAQAVGITRQNLNAFLNRRIDLMPEVVDRLIEVVGTSWVLLVLSAPAQFEGTPE
jgi:plasmid maintenance system antidote protein VapI